MSRTEFTKATQRSAWGRSDGRCEYVDEDGSRCPIMLGDGNVHYDHDIPDRIGGDNSLDNCRALCLPHHKMKTRDVDIPRIVKTRRQEDKARGIKKPKGRPLPGTKASGLRKRMNGDVEKWT